MLHHLSIGVRDLDRAAAFYDAVLAPMGYRRVWTAPDAVGYGWVDGEDKFAIKLRAEGLVVPRRGFHVAFAAPSRAAVDAFHAVAMRTGARDRGGPRSWPEFGPHYYAAYVVDPDGHHLEAVIGTPSVEIAAADPRDAGAIAQVIEAAKRSLPYDERYVAAALPLLAVDAAYLERNAAFVARLDGRIVGFAAVVVADEGPVLDHLWVVPALHRRGVGRALFVQARAAAPAGPLTIVADPPSEGFYLRLGARRVGLRPSRVAGGPVFPVLVV